MTSDDSYSKQFTSPHLLANIPMKHLLDPESAAFSDWLTLHNLPAFRERQIQKWLFENRAEEFEEMTDLPKP
ncbi:MAG: adenine C2-methylase RlmN of 23S rRNA A2503 and tRNA A37, partial [Pirellulaceae bacterium]